MGHHRRENTLQFPPACADTRDKVIAPRAPRGCQGLSGGASRETPRFRFPPTLPIRMGSGDRHSHRSYVVGGSAAAMLGRLTVLGWPHVFRGPAEEKVTSHAISEENTAFPSASITASAT
jgi:hypothetical protein